MRTYCIIHRYLVFSLISVQAISDSLESVNNEHFLCFELEIHCTRWRFQSNQDKAGAKSTDIELKILGIYIV